MIYPICLVPTVTVSVLCIQGRTRLAGFSCLAPVVAAYTLAV